VHCFRAKAVGESITLTELLTLYLDKGTTKITDTQSANCSLLARLLLNKLLLVTCMRLSGEG
jgi:hypothetical protein